MSNTLFDAGFGQLQRVLDLRSQQHGHIASNLANANTPNYKAKELEFQNTLKQVMERPAAPMQMARTDSSHIGGRRGVETLSEVIEHDAPAWSTDGNSVIPEEESAKMAENQLLFKALTKVLRKEFDQLRTAIQDVK